MSAVLRGYGIVVWKWRWRTTSGRALAAGCRFWLGQLVLRQRVPFPGRSGAGRPSNDPGWRVRVRGLARLAARRQPTHT